MDPASSQPSPVPGQLASAQAAATSVVARPVSFLAKHELDFSLMPAGLSEQQKVVLRLLFKGESLDEAGDGAGCDRSTIFRWRQRDESFRIAYRVMKQQRRFDVRADLQSLAPDCVIGLRLAVARGDKPNLNLRILDRLGHLQPDEDEPQPEPNEDPDPEPELDDKVG